ncbi:MAG: hypothetical protein IJG65_01425 [Synergistaceae bacterium]|nr:hypothetical protein [Synergistaceae bacterium]
MPLIFTLMFFVELPSLFVALTLKVHVPRFDGAPFSVPSDARVNDVGRDPPAMLHVMGESPFAVSFCE